MVQQQGVSAQLGDAIELVRNDHDRNSAGDQLANPAECPLLEREVADRQDLVHDQHLGIEVRGDAKPSRAFMPLE